MKKTLRPILSILLAFAMILPLAGVARADDEPATPVYATSVELEAKNNVTTLYTPTSHEHATVEIIAKITSEGTYNQTIKWDVTDSSSLLASSPSTDAATYDAATNGRITLTLKDGATSGTITVKATVKQSGGSDLASSPLNITVAEDSLIDSNPITLTGSSGNIEVKDTKQLTATVKYKSGYSEHTASLFNFTSGNPDIATVNDSGLVTGVAPGNADITAKLKTDDSKSSSFSITVAKPTATIEASTTVNETLSLSDVYSRLRSAFRAKYGDYPTTDAKVALSGYTNTDTNIGTIYADRNTEAENKEYSFSALEDFTFSPEKSGEIEFTATVKDGTKELIGNVTLTVTVPTKNIRIPVDSSSNYSFDERALDSRSTGVDIINNALSGVDYKSITFGSVTSRSNIGTLYTSSSARTRDEVDSGVTVDADDLGDLYFIPGRSSGVYTISYTAYSKSGGAQGTGVALAEGTLSIALDPTSLEVSVKLDSTDPYTFGEAPNKNTTATRGSAEVVLLDAIDENLDSWSYICFNTRSTSSVGTLYASQSAYRSSNELSSTAEIRRSAVEDLYFVPERTGTYEVPFSVYSSGDVLLASGTLTITVVNDLGDMDFQYTTTTGGTVKLLEKDFADFIEEELGRKYDLSYITLDRVSGSGTFYNGSKSFTPSSSTKFYADDSDDATKSSSFISDLSFTAPSKGTGHTSVKFTAYYSSTRYAEGVFYIFYSAADVPSIDYNAYSSTSTLFGTYAVTLRESDFASVYRTAMGAAATTNPQFFIRLQSLPTPGYGLLYQNYASTLSTGSPLNSATIATGSYYVGGNSTLNSVSTLTYAPLGNYSALTNAAYGTMDTVKYIAYSTSGTPLFTGTIRFKLAPDKTVSVPSDGLDFSVSDFYSVSDSDPILYVTFAQPLAGKLYVTSGGRMIAVTPTTKLYTATATDGAYPVSLTHYVPQVGSTSPVTLNYTAHTRSGASYTNSIVVNPSKKTASTRFNDIPAATAGWAADSIDFAGKYNLVQGTGNGKFEPDAKMHRCDLVLILYRLAGSPAVSSASPYSDVAADKYYYASAVWAAANHIMDGVVTGDKYVPMGNITRQDYVRILYNYAKAMGGSVASSGSITNYTDASKVASYATTAMQWAVANRYITSTDSNRLVLSPDREATRAEIVTLLHRYLTY